MALFFLVLATVSGKLFVHDPDDLKSKFVATIDNSIPSSLANFGNPPYGSSFIGRLYQVGNETKACLPLEAINFSDTVGIFNHPIVMVDRGNCSFVVKVRNAQNIGASAVIIVDNKVEDPERVVMIDDGTAGNIFIPSVLISAADGRVLREYIKSHKDDIVRMQMTFEMPNPDSRVEYEIWMSSEQPKIRRFLVDFAPMAKKLSFNALMNPHYVLWYCIECMDKGYVEEHKDCVSAGRYCAPDPDADGPRTGREIVIEDLRQICVFKYAEQKKKYSIWWDYVAAYGECEFTETCATNSLKKAGIVEKDIKTCMDESVMGSNLNVADNSLLRDERELMIERGIFFYPSLIINNQTFRGDLEAEEVLMAICAGFRVKPEYCEEYFENIDEEGKTVTKKGVSGSTIMIIVLFSVLLLLAILFFYRKWLRRDMNIRMKAEVSSAVSQYIALTDQSINRE